MTFIIDYKRVQVISVVKRKEEEQTAESWPIGTFISGKKLQIVSKVSTQIITSINLILLTFSDAGMNYFSSLFWSPTDRLKTGGLKDDALWLNVPDTRYGSKLLQRTTWGRGGRQCSSRRGDIMRVNGNGWRCLYPEKLTTEQLSGWKDRSWRFVIYMDIKIMSTRVWQQDHW